MRAILLSGGLALIISLLGTRYAIKLLSAKGYGTITTEIREAPTFYYAEPYHQQYLGKNPNGYCGLGGTGVSCPIGVASTGD